MHPDSQVFDIDDPRLLPVYEHIQGKLPVMLHMGDHRYDYSHPVKLRKVLDQFPRLQVIAAHFGGHTMYETAFELQKDTDCIVDLSSSMMFMEAGQPEKFVNLYGAQRVAYGTDYPMWDPVEETQRFLRLKLKPQQLEQIAWKTATDFLNL
jgi:predicted TIM-barrel fold metal-dependent hydrolase